MRSVFLIFITFMLISCGNKDGSATDDNLIVGNKLQAGPDVNQSYPYTQYTQVATEGNGGDITYSSSNPDIATISPVTGEVIIHSFGITTITASEASTDKFLAQSDTYLLKVTSLGEGLNITPSVQVIENDTHASIHISALDINEINVDDITTASFAIKPKPDTFAEELSATYLLNELTLGKNSLTLPIFGMYSNYTNQIEITLTFIDKSTAEFIKPITIPAMDINSIYNSRDIVSPTTADNLPSFSYFVMKSKTNGPIIMDIDAEIRWQLPEKYNATSTLFENNKLISVVGDKIRHIYLDGRIKEYPILATGELTDIVAHHGFSKGKLGYLIEIDATKNGQRLIESILLETDEFGNEIKQWQFSEIFRDYLTANAEDSANFVRDDVDWFHMNSAIYNQNDNTILVSSRENFVVNIDYESKEIQWLLGDETKHWYVNFPSLQALSLISSDIKPIGQHSLSIVDNDLLLFNNGAFSFNSPEDEPRGGSLASSLATRYTIDEENKTAMNVWSYDAGLLSEFCSSIYKAQSEEEHYLITYARSVKPTIQIINAEKEILFHVELESSGGCNTTWNSEPIDLSMIQH